MVIFSPLNSMNGVKSNASPDWKLPFWSNPFNKEVANAFGLAGRITVFGVNPSTVNAGDSGTDRSTFVVSAVTLLLAPGKRLFSNPLKPACGTGAAAGFGVVALAGADVSDAGAIVDRVSFTTLEDDGATRENDAGSSRTEPVFCELSRSVDANITDRPLGFGSSRPMAPDLSKKETATSSPRWSICKFVKNRLVRSLFTPATTACGTTTTYLSPLV